MMKLKNIKKKVTVFTMASVLGGNRSICHKWFFNIGHTASGKGNVCRF